MLDFISDHLIAIMVSSLILIGTLMVLAVWNLNVNCLRGHQGPPYYRAPTYMMMGKVLMPVGGGIQSDYICDNEKKKNR